MAPIQFAPVFLSVADLCVCSTEKSFCQLLNDWIVESGYSRPTKTEKSWAIRSAKELVLLQ